MTLAEQWKQEGRAEGIEKGERAILELERWAERILTATSLENVLA